MRQFCCYFVLFCCALGIREKTNCTAHGLLHMGSHFKVTHSNPNNEKKKKAIIFES